MRALLPEEEIEIARRYTVGDSARALAANFSVSVPTIYAALARHGIEPHIRRTGEAMCAIAVEMCRHGATLEQTAQKLRVSTSTVERAVRAARDAGKKVTIRRGRPRERAHQTSVWHRELAAKFEIVPVPTRVVEAMCVEHHAYGSAGQISTYAFAVVEEGRPVAAFAWQPPALGGARKACPEAPEGVLALSRMVAVPHAERQLRHISKPLRYQMHSLIDRTRWPVLITYSDEGLGHTGHVYRCSGWLPTERAKRNFYVDSIGRRVSLLSLDKKNRDESDLRKGGTTTLLRWEHRVCARGRAAEWMSSHGWKRIETGRVWRSGHPAFTWIRE